MRVAGRLIVRFAILALGALLAVAITTGVGAADTTTDTTTTPATTETAPVTTETTTAETTTEPATNGTTTVEVTTTRFVPVQATTTSSDSDSSTPPWVWVLLAILGVALIVVIVLLGRRGGGSSMSLEDRHRQLDATVGTWAAQGWALETQTDDSAVLRRGAEAMHVSVDRAGHVSTRPLP
jgi:hypothetical protein